MAATAQAGYSPPEPEKNYVSSYAWRQMLDPPRPGLPPLLALRAFEAAARHESFVAAAAELHVSAGAIAQQIRKLEAWVGHPLFRRMAQGVILTEEARLALPALGDAFAVLGSAAARLAGNAERPQIRLAALPAIAQCWIAPRLARLKRDFPALDLSLTAMEQPPDLAREPFDAALFYSNGDHSGVETRLLARDATAPVCSPALLAGPPPVQAPADLARVTLLHDSVWREDWRRWLVAAGLHGAVDPYRGPAYSLYSLVLQAALDGAGIAIGHYPLVASALADGRLVAPFCFWTESARSIWLLLPRRPAPLVTALADWLERDAADIVVPA